MPIDLFDWLDIIGSLKKAKLTQKEIGERIGWSREQVKDYITLLDKVGAEILNLCRAYQKGRAPEKGAIAPFPFTEGWFRNSGVKMVLFKIMITV